jgi:hypothetical protein
MPTIRERREQYEQDIIASRQRKKAGILGYVYWSTVAYVSKKLDRTIMVEQALLIKTYDSAGRSGLTALINQRVAERDGMTVTSALPGRQIQSGQEAVGSGLSLTSESGSRHSVRGRLADPHRAGAPAEAAARVGQDRSGRSASQRTFVLRRRQQ